MRQTHNEKKTTNKNKKKTKFQSAFKEERRKHDKLSLLSVRFALRVLLRELRRRRYLSRGQRGAHLKHIYDFMIQTTSAAMAIVCQTLVLR